MTAVCRRASGFYPFLTGLFFGLLQTGLFLQLTLTLSSAFGTFLMITLCWLTGSAIGVLASPRLLISLNGFVVLSLLAYFACAGLLQIAPFETGIWWLYAALIVLMGLYPGAFFARMSTRLKVSKLFFQENNGFLLGLTLGGLLFASGGRIGLWIPSTLIAVCLLLMGRNLQTDRRESVS